VWIKEKLKFRRTIKIGAVSLRLAQLTQRPAQVGIWKPEFASVSCA
jgi:hypothetical protein